MKLIFEYEINTDVPIRFPEIISIGGDRDNSVFLDDFTKDE